MADQVLPKGIRLFNKHANAPDFVKGSIVITLNELVQFAKDNPSYLTEYNGNKQIKLQILESKKGDLYCAVDQYKAGEAKPKQQPVWPGNKSSSKPEVIVDDGGLPF